VDARRLDVFATVARESSFSRAAEILHLSQPAVSQLVASLEAELGVRLFDRSRRGVRLTPAGRALAGHAERLLRDMDDARRAVAEAAGAITGSLRVGASQTVGHYVLPAVMAEFARLYPAVTVRVGVQNTERVAALLLAGEVDVGFVEGHVGLPGIVVRPFARDELVVIAHPGHPWARRAQVRLEHLVAEPIVLREPGSGTRQVTEESLRRAGIDPESLTVVMELAGAEAIKTAVEAGVGVAVVSRATVAKELRLKTLVARPVRGMAMPRDLVSAVVAGRVLHPAARALLDRVYRMPDETGSLT